MSDADGLPREDGVANSTETESRSSQGRLSRNATVWRWQAPNVASWDDRGAQRTDPLTAGRLAGIEQQARSEGYQRGLEEGRRDAEGQTRRVARRLEALFAAVDPQAGVLDDQLLDQLADLVVAIARQLVRRELKCEPGEIVRVVREAMSALPASDATIRVVVHPDDAALLRQTLRPETFERSVQILEDVAMTCGGARLETAVSQVDARVETRINSIAARVFGDERADHRAPENQQSMVRCAEPAGSDHEAEARLDDRARESDP